MEDNKAKSISDLLDVVSGDIAQKTGMSRSEALAQDKCARCGGDAKEFRNEASRKEYPLTAWCQGCQDDFFGAA